MNKHERQNTHRRTHWFCILGRVPRHDSSCNIGSPQKKIKRKYFFACASENFTTGILKVTAGGNYGLGQAPCDSHGTLAPLYLIMLNCKPCEEYLKLCEEHLKLVPCVNPPYLLASQNSCDRCACEARAMAGGNIASEQDFERKRVMRYDTIKHKTCTG